MIDYYETLGVTRASTKKEIKDSYKKIAKKYHPDKNPNDDVAEQKFKEATEAYDTLSDDVKRSKYDSKMSFSFDFNRWGGSFGTSDTTSFKTPVRQAPPKGDDLMLSVSLTLEEIYNGCEKTIKINKWNICNICDGSGAKEYKTCLICKGAGVVRKMERTSILGRSIKAVACNKCLGSGLEIKDPCLECQGRGRVKGEKKVKVKIPSLVKHGNFIVIEGHGDAGKNGGGCGNLQIKIKEIPDKTFTRKGDDLEYVVDVNISDVVLGTVVSVPTLFEKVEMKIPGGTQPNTKFRVKGKGLSEKNDLLVTVNVIIPEELTEKHTKIFNKLKDLEKELKFD